MAHMQTPPAPQALPGVAHIVAVGSGKGGVGKTTLSVNLATALAKLGFRVGLIDADIYGPNVPLMMGVGRQPRVLENNQIEPLESHGVKLISVGFISPGDKPLVMRGPMLHQIIRQFLQQVQWGELDFLIVDLPPGTGDVVISNYAEATTVTYSASLPVSSPFKIDANASGTLGVSAFGSPTTAKITVGLANVGSVPGDISDTMTVNSNTTDNNNDNNTVTVVAQSASNDVSVTMVGPTSPVTTTSAVSGRRRSS